MQADVILIGPPRVGKSSIGKLISAQMALPFTDLSKLSTQYYGEQGHDQQLARQAWETEGLVGFLRYQDPFELHALERGLQEHGSGVVEVGAAQIALIDHTLLERVRQAFQPYQHIVLLLPSADVDTSVQVLDQRGRIVIDGMEIDEHFVRHHSNHDLARIRVYTKGKTPQQTCDAIIQQLKPDAPEILLIGPFNTGKSTLGKLLAQQLGRPQISLDTVREKYYQEIGYDRALQQEINEREGFGGVYRYWKRFEVYAVERVLQDHPGAVIDFGAGHSVQEDPATFSKLQAILAPYPNIVLILPSPDLDESVAILRDRTTPKIEGVPLTSYLVTHPGFSMLATHVIYTEGATAEQTSAEIMRLVSGTV